MILNSLESETMHKSVLLQEVLAHLSPKEGEVFIDATIGFGGHAEAILRAIGPKGTLLGLDQDQEAVDWLKANLAPKYPNLIIEKANFSQISEIADRKGLNLASGILADIGVSSYQLDQPERGFSFRENGPLDMRMDKDRELTAEKILSDYGEEDLVGIFQRYGEERLSKTIAREIVAIRGSKSLKTTKTLAELVEKTYQKKGLKRGKIHLATQVFQALRIEVNDELGSLEKFLPQAIDLLATDGRLGVITFHSMEDRIVKQYFKKEAKGCICPPEIPKCQCGHEKRVKILTKKPITASKEELNENPRSRSAKLRVIQKIGK